MRAELLPILWPVFATVAVAWVVRTREGRRRLALNRALHELRRPLHALALVPAGGFRRGPAAAPGSLDLALAALEDLDVAVNGSRRELERRPVPARALVAGALERWRAQAARKGRALSLAWEAGRAYVLADPVRIAQALDNLIANALEHGGLRVHIEARVTARGLRITVADGGVERTARHRRGPRRGHGLEIVAAIADAHGGRFELQPEVAGTVAVLELPLAVAPLPALPIEAASPDFAGRAPGRARPLPRGPASPSAA